MSSAPEKINIKRRRDEEPVDTLGEYWPLRFEVHFLHCVVFAKRKKQRTSDHVFVRVRREDGKPWIESAVKPATPPVAPLADGSNRGSIPTVRTTQPGEEVKDFQRYKAAQDARMQPQSARLPEAATSSQPPLSLFSHLTATPHSDKARQFHLTRDLSTTLRPHSSGGIRKTKSLRPHLPTFVERLQSTKNEDISIHAKPPIDRIIRSLDQDHRELEPQKILLNGDSVSKTAVPTFQRPKSGPKTGRSIKDDPDTWNLQSDQLADELLALALEMDPTAKAAYASESAAPAKGNNHMSWEEQMNLEQSDDFVYETYVRVQSNALNTVDSLSVSTKLGYLVIDEEEEDLWDQYLQEEDEDEDDWDDEDEDSNGMATL